MLLLVAAAPASAGERTAAFVDVNIVPMTGPGAVAGQTVVVEDGRIVSVAPAGTAAIPKDAVRINGSGKYLLPGLSDMHAHVGGYAGIEGIGANVPVAKNQFLLYAASGVTLLRDPSGTDAHFGYRQKLDDGEWIGPRLYFTSTVIEGEKAVWPFSTIVTDPQAIEPLFAGYANQGYWGVKLYHTISSDVYHTALAAAEQHRLKVVGHVPFEVGIEGALKAGQYSIEHFRGYDFDGISAEELFIDGGRNEKRFSVFARMSEERLNEFVQMTVAAGVWNTPTLIVNAFLFDGEGRAATTKEPKMRFVHPALRRQVSAASALDALFSEGSRTALRKSMPRQQVFLKRLNDAGGKLLIGTDTIVPAYVPGFGLVEEMNLFIEAGISPYDTLRAATVNAAQSLGLDHRLGTIAVGMDADLILLDGNPLESLEPLVRPVGVMLRGEWWTIEEIEALLDEMAGAWESAP